MTSDWWTYRPEDFLLFSSRVYWRLFELQNQALWPLPALALALGAFALLALARPRSWSDRPVWAGLAIAWAWVGWSFLWTRYASINWAASYAATAFFVQAVMLGWEGAVRNRLRLTTGRGTRRVVGLGLFVYALALHPLVPIAAGRPIAGAEILGIAPDPTAIATLGLLLLAATGWRRALVSAVPLIWCALSWITLQTMGEAEGAVPLAALILYVAASWPGFDASQSDRSLV